MNKVIFINNLTNIGLSFGTCNGRFRQAVVQHISEFTQTLLEYLFFTRQLNTLHKFYA